jgi:hypothetical protein
MYRRQREIKLLKIEISEMLEKLEMSRNKFKKTITKLTFSTTGRKKKMSLKQQHFYLKALLSKYEDFGSYLKEQREKLEENRKNTKQLTKSEEQEENTI